MKTLAVEMLEQRLLLTTLILPKGATNEMVFQYADGEENTPGDEVDAFNEIRIGTLSGLGPSKDVVIEILNYRGEDIPGDLFFDDGTLNPAKVSLYGGPGGVAVIEEVPPDELYGLSLGLGSCNALATSPAGVTYGISTSGLLAEIDTTTGTAVPIDSVVDTDNFLAPFGYVVQYSSFEAAAFDPNTGELYAVVIGPTDFDAIGDPIDEEHILIKIDVNTGEADPAGVNPFGQPDYRYSSVSVLGSDPDRITTIVYDEVRTANNATGGPVFIGYAEYAETTAGQTNDNPPDYFVSISVNPSSSTSAVNISTSPILIIDEEDPIEGLMYDNNGWLFGLLGGDANTLVYVNLEAAGDAETYIDVVDYGDNPREVQIELTGMTFDSANNMGYATDPNTATLYTVNTNALIQEFDEEGGFNFSVQGGLSDVYMVYIAQSTPDVYITFTYYNWDDTDGEIYEPTGGDPAFMFYDIDEEDDVETPEEAGGVMIGTRPIIHPDEEISEDPDYIWSPTTFFDSSELSEVDPGAHGAYPGGYYRPGIVLARDIIDADNDGVGDPQYIGKIQVGGCVFGDVIIEGAIDTFYAGYLGTNRFEVLGDLNTLVVSTMAGGIVTAVDSWVPVGGRSGYVTNRISGQWLWGDGESPILSVGGSMDSFYCNGTDGDLVHWGLPIRVYSRSDAPAFPGVLDPSVSNPADGVEIYVDAVREIERKFDDDEETIYFPWGALDFDSADEWIITNDSPYLAQYVGASTDGNISVIGSTEGGSDLDPEDFYSFGALAGETLTIELFDTSSFSNYFTGHPNEPNSLYAINETYYVKLYDTEWNLVATSGGADLETGQAIPIEFTAERSGIYTISIMYCWSYRLDISGLSPMSLGGGNVVGETRDGSVWGADLPLIQVVDGNMGALSVGSVMRGGEIRVDQGSLAALRAATNAIDPELTDINVGPNKIGDNNPWHFADEEIEAPDPDPDMGFGYEILDEDSNIFHIDWDLYSYVNSVQVVTGGDIGMISSPLRSGIDLYAGGDLHSFRIGGNMYAPEPSGEDDQQNNQGDGSDPQDYAGFIVANGHIGEISITGHYGPVMWGDVSDENDGGVITLYGGIFANADGIGVPGIIDSIIIGGWIGRNPDAPANDAYYQEIPISTGRVSAAAGGGNVRFVDIRGPIVVDTAGWFEIPPSDDIDEDESFGPFSFDPGQAVVIKDDSGALVRLAPGHTGEDVEDYLFGAAPSPGFNLPREGDGGILTIKMIPIRDQLYEEFLNGVYEGGLDINQSVQGFAIIDVQSTDGLRVKSDGGAADIGSLTVEGRVDDTILIYGNEPVSVMRITASAPVAREGTEQGQGQNQTDQVAELPNTGIWRIENRTVGGDILSIQIGSAGGGETTGGVVNDQTPGETVEDVLVEWIKVKGHLGYTTSSTGQLVRSTILSLVTENDGYNLEDPTVNADPGGTQWVGLLSSADIDLIRVTGSIADVDVRGNVRKIEINSDDSRGVGQFDGVTGPIIIYGDLDKIELGDGIGEPGTGRFAQSGVFVYGILDEAELIGAGREIAGPIFSQEEIGEIDVRNGAKIVGYNYLYGVTGERVRGAFIQSPTIAVTDQFDDFMLSYLNNMYQRGTSGIIGKINVKGEDSEIRGVTIWAANIDEINVISGANGIFDSRIYAQGTQTIAWGNIDQIKVGGEGIYNTVIMAGRELDDLNVLSGGVLQDSEIRVSYEIDRIIADQINRTDIDAYNEVKRITARQGIYDLVLETGELGYLKAKGDILGSAIYVGGKVKEISTKGDLISTIDITGPYGDLKKLSAAGDIGTPTGGQISIDGQVGSIQAGGDFLADLYINWDPTPASAANPQGPHAKYSDRSGVELGSLKAGGQIVGLSDIGGDVNVIQSGDEFGAFSSVFTVHGDLKTLKIGSSRNLSDLESSLVVEGQLGSVTVYGSVNGQIDVVENFNSLTLKGSTTHRADLNASITVGGDFKKLSITNGDIAMTDIVDGGVLTITPTPLKQTIRGSDIDGVIIDDGSEETKSDGFDIDGNLNGIYVAKRDVGTIHLGGNISESGVLIIDGDLDQLIVDGNIEGQVYVTGNIGTIRAANMGLDVGGIVATVSAGGDIGIIDVDGVMKDSYILAGFNPGITSEDISNPDFDPTVLIYELSVDGTGIDPQEEALQGDIQKVTIGVLNNSVIAAGVSPGVNNIFGDIDGSDTPGTGLSSIQSVSIESITEGAPATFGVFADTQIKTLRIDGKKTSLPVLLNNGFRSWTIDSLAPGPQTGFEIFQGNPLKTQIGEKLVMVTMSGPGIGVVVPSGDGIDLIQLSGTTRKTKLMVQARGSESIDVGRVVNGDDESLGQLSIDGRIIGDFDLTNEDLSIGGGIDKLQLGGVGSNTTLVIGGDVQTADLGCVTDTEDGDSTVTIAGDVKKLSVNNQNRIASGNGVTDYLTITANNVNQFKVTGSFDGVLCIADQLLQSASISGNLGGVISSNGDIGSVVVKGVTGGEGIRAMQGIRAAGTIGSFVTGSMDTAVAAAGGDFLSAWIKDDMIYSTLASGLDIGLDGILADGDDTPMEGDLLLARIGGDFIESNITAGLAPGDDKMLGTADDTIDHAAIEGIDPPTVEKMYFSDQNTLALQFAVDSQDPSSHIQKVVIRGNVLGSFDDNDRFAIAASGVVKEVWEDRAVFEGADNVIRENITYKGLDPSTIIVNDITTANALSLAFQISTDGLDQTFNTSDDVVISGDNNPATQRTAYITYDETTNTVYYHKTDGFTINSMSSNYYQVFVDAALVTNRFGVALDGDHDGVPGGNYVAYFAVADLGGSLTAAFAPFDSFPENLKYWFEGKIGDDLNNSATNLSDDLDYFRLNDLEAGQILNITLADPLSEYSGYRSMSFDVGLYRIDANDREVSFGYLYELNAVDDPEPNMPNRDLVIPELDELAYAVDTFYGYDNIGQQFYRISQSDYSIELMENSLTDLNSLTHVAQQGTITDLNALTGYSSDSLWAVADFQPISGQDRSSLVIIQKLNLDVNSSSNPDYLPEVTLFSNDVGFDEIVGLAFWNGNLYGVDSATNTLVKFDLNPSSPTYGAASAVGAELGNLDNSDLVPAGLAVNPDGTGLILLHDQPVNVFDNYMVDSLYTVNPVTAEATLLQEFEQDRELHGLASRAGGSIVVGVPLRNSPLTDTVEITLTTGSRELTLDHVFGTDTTDFGGGITVNSNPLDVLENALLQEFVDGGYYYAFEINYVPNRGDMQITIENINWVNDTEFGFVLDSVTDEPGFTEVDFGYSWSDEGSYLTITIGTDGGDGNVMVYFTGTSAIEVLVEPELAVVDGILGETTRSDLDPLRDTIVPSLDELTINSDIFTVYDDLKQDTFWYDSVGFDVEQGENGLFVYVNSDSYDCRPILVPDPGDPLHDILLTGQALSDIYNGELDSDVTFDNIRALEFGRDNQLFMIVSVLDSETGVTISRDSLLIVEDITNPALGMYLSDHDLISEYGFSNITELAYGLTFENASDVNGLLYGYDIVTDTLILIDPLPLTNYNQLLTNPNYGKAVAIGGEMGNLVDTGSDTFEIKGLDFDGTGVLYAVVEMQVGGQEKDRLVQIQTDTVLNPNSERVELVQDLPTGDYSTLTYDPILWWPGAAGYVVRVVNGSPVGQTISISVENADAVSHTFGGDDTIFTSGPVTGMSSNVGNSTSEVAEEGGFYQFTIAYVQDQGDIEVTISDIAWPEGSSGDIDSIIFNDPTNVQLMTYSGDSMTFIIDSNDGAGLLTVYFGATADILVPTTGQVLVPVDISDTFNEDYGWFDFSAQISQSGDYVLIVGGNWTGGVLNYDLNILVFDDGNSDFGVTETASGNYLYQAIAPNDSPIDLGTNSQDLIVNSDDPNLFSYSNEDWPVTVTGEILGSGSQETPLLDPGVASHVIVDATLEYRYDVDVYTFQLEFGQTISVDIEADTLQGRESLMYRISVGIYNGDLEAIAAVSTDPDDDLSISQQADSYYSVQAVNQIANHSTIIDPGEDGVGTYYVVVSIDTVLSQEYQETGYRLIIETTDTETVETPASQLVWLCFDGAKAEYLVESFGPGVVNRPDFDIEDFQLGTTSQDWFEQQVLERVEAIYRAAGLTESEIEFTLEKPALGTTYSTVIFGGELDGSLAGLAESVDRNNSDRTDKAVVLTETIGRSYLQFMDDDLSTRIEQAIHLVANIGAHELGHILGLEHATESLVNEPNNIMNYNDVLTDLDEQEFEERTNFIDFAKVYYGFVYNQIGFQNEIDSLLRNIGSGTVMGT